MLPASLKMEVDDEHRPSISIPSVNSRRRSSAQSTSSNKSSPALPSPSIVAARAYLLEQISPFPIVEHSRKLDDNLPRRKSSASDPGGLATQLQKFTFAPHAKNLAAVDEEVRLKNGGGSEDEGSTTETGEHCEVHPPHPHLKRKSVIVSHDPSEVLRQVPFEFTHRHLRDWGYAYMGNVATADVFVNAVALRRPSMGSTLLSDESLTADRTLTTIRARILPKAKERKPFLLQRQFDIEELRASVPLLAPVDEFGDSTENLQVRRRTRSRRVSTQLDGSSAGKRKMDNARHHNQAGSGKLNTTVPIRELGNPMNISG